MTVPSDLETEALLETLDSPESASDGLTEPAPVETNQGDTNGSAALDLDPEPDLEAESEAVDFMDEVPDDLEMSLFDHLEELRLRIFYALIAIVLGIILCFVFVNPIVMLLEVPAQGIKFLQLAPGEYFFVSLKVAGYSGLVVASPFVLYQIIQFVLPGLTRRERRLLIPVMLGSTVLFIVGLVFAYYALIPAALNFFVSYGEGVVEQMWSIERYFEFVLLLLFSTGLAFQIPIIQLLLGALGIVNSKQMLAGWRFVVVGGAVLGAVLTPSTDPVTQSLLAGAVLTLYFGGIGLVKLIGR
jgi:sec-independent protein translocase protein TatC